MTLFANAEDRTVRGLLLPFGEESRLNVSGTEPLSFAAGTVKLPRDPKALNANIAHDRYKPAARFETIEETDAGLVASFAVHDTDEGDELLAGIASGRLTRLSAEVRDLVRKGATAVSAVLTGAAFVPEGAFASAALFAIGEVTEALDGTLGPDEDGHLAVLSTELPNDITVTTPEGESAVYTPEPTPAEETQPESEFAAMPTSIVPDGVVTPEAETIDTSASALFAALARKGFSGDSAPLAPFAGIDSANTGLFALADITATDTAVTVQSQFVGEIWKKKAYNQRVLPLFEQANLTALKVTGWKWTTPPEVGDYAGDKAEVPSNDPVMDDAETVAERIAGAHDVDRALRDFGNEQFWASYFRAMTESYAKKADAKVFAKIAAAPGSGGATVVTPGAVPSGVAAGTAAIVDGAVSIVSAGYAPSFALVSTAIWRELLLTPKDKFLEFLNASLDLRGEEGNIDSFRLVPHASLAAKRVIVGAREAATVYQLPGSPIRVEGLDIAKGGIDPAVFGYVATMINDQTALASVTTV